MLANLSVVKAYAQRVCICDDGEFDAGHAQPQSTIKETKFYLKRKHN